MLARIGLSIIVAVVVILACIFVGGLVITSNLNILVFLGTFLKVYGYVLGIVAGAVYYFTHPRTP